MAVDISGMSLIQCEICGEKAVTICPRCYRYVCEKCFDVAMNYCVDCSRFKREEESDLVRSVKSMKKKVNFIRENLDRCFNCPLLKDEIMRFLYLVKSLEAKARLDSMEELENEILSLKEDVQKLGIEYLVKFRMRST